MQAPLAGIRVLALEQAVAGPLCTRHLADLGADVIKVERPGSGDFARSYDTTINGMSSYFFWLNRGKRSLTLDMKSEGAGTLLERLAGSSDVVVQNLGPGAAERLGVGPETLLGRFPGLVICAVSGYGTGGPFDSRKAFDLLLQGETGVIATTGDGDMMAKVGISVGDIGAGVYGALGVLAALMQKRETGRGQIVTSSLFDALSEWMGYPAYFTRYGGSPPGRAGIRHATVVPYGAYRCGDGDQILFAVQTENQWRSFCEIVCERPDWLEVEQFSTTTDRRVNRDLLEAEIEHAFEPLTRAEVRDRLERADVPYGDLNTIEQFLQHPQLAARNRWQEVETPGGLFEAMLPPFGFSECGPQMAGVPSVGQHTTDILREVGYSHEEIEAMRRQGMI